VKNGVESLSISTSGLELYLGVLGDKARVEFNQGWKNLGF